MSRTARLTVPGLLHHVISRFVDREWFFTSLVERARYLALLGRALTTSDWRCVAYCLMSNHVHLAMVGGATTLESWVKKVHSPFARWMNERHGRLGSLFADRPSVYLVPRNREPAVIAYIHNNPVRAKVVDVASSSRWTSHRAYLGVGSCPTWLDVGDGLSRAGCLSDPASFDGLVNQLAGEALELPELGPVRARVRRHGAYDVGTPTLSDPIEVPVVCRWPLRPRPTATSLLESVAAAAGISASAATRRHARGDIAMVKRAFIHAAVQCGLSIAEAAAALNVSRQRGSKIATSPPSTDERALILAAIALAEA